MMATVPHVTSGSGLRKFLADGFLFDRVYLSLDSSTVYSINLFFKNFLNSLHSASLKF